MTGTLNDTELVRGCIANDRRAQEQLYKQFYGPMASICMRYTRNQHDAIEVLHNGFLKVYRNMERFDPAKASLYTWIRTIVIHTAIDFIRQKARWYVPHGEIETAEAAGIDAEAIQRMSARELLTLVQELPPATQMVFNLYVMEGYTHKEIGTLLGISDGTSKWHLSEARRQLQNLVSKHANVAQ
ncbi:MAG TPA: sigma-70 family RNA polymerase sigma factor [Chitinophagaceae bacterium]|nr:sigma-70 family RNA polymerase sigma factor [Chitinophagaceae bacterium]